MLKGNEKGQSLIEVLVVGVVSAIMILALIMIILNSLKNAQFAQNQTQATKWAQDTVDQIRSLRDNNKFNTISNGGTYYCFIELWGNIDMANPLNCGGTTTCYFNLSASYTLDKKNDASYVDFGNGFSRQIKISQSVLVVDEANVIVTINWNDSSGSHSSQLETVITKPNYDCSN